MSLARGRGLATVASSLRCPKDGGQVNPQGKCVVCGEPVKLGRPWSNRNRASARGRLHTQLSYDGEA